MASDGVINMDPLDENQLAIEPDLICHAWLESHFGNPGPGNPLTVGLFHSDTHPTTSSSSSTVVPARSKSVPTGVTPPKCPFDLSMGVPGDGGSDAPQTRHHTHPENCYSGRLRHRCPRELVVGGTAPGCPNAMPDAEVEVGAAHVHAAAGSSRPRTAVDNEGENDSLIEASWDSSSRSHFKDGLLIAGSANVAMPAPPPPPPPAPPPRNKRKAKSLSPTRASIHRFTSDTGDKRRRLKYLNPLGASRIPDDPDDNSLMPVAVVILLALTFSVGFFEIGCFPITPAIEIILARFFPHESIPLHARFVLPNTTGAHHARGLIEYAINIHRACLKISDKPDDDIAWAPLVRSLLSVLPPPTDSSAPRISRPPYRSPPSRSSPINTRDLFLAIDATTKSTAADLPATTNATDLDALLALNPGNPLCAPIRAPIVVLGVVVASAADAEYHINAWGTKTLTQLRSDRGRTKCDYALGVSVCAHVWSYHISYWRGGSIVTHAPVVIGATNTLYGTVKIVAFVRRFKEWAGEVLLADWVAVAKGGGSEGRGGGGGTGVGTGMTGTVRPALFECFCPKARVGAVQN